MRIRNMLILSGVAGVLALYVPSAGAQVSVGGGSVGGAGGISAPGGGAGGAGSLGSGGSPGSNGSSANSAQGEAASSGAALPGAGNNTVTQQQKNLAGSNNNPVEENASKLGSGSGQLSSGQFSALSPQQQGNQIATDISNAKQQGADTSQAERLRQLGQTELSQGQPDAASSHFKQAEQALSSNSSHSGSGGASSSSNAGAGASDKGASGSAGGSVSGGTKM